MTCMVGQQAAMHRQLKSWHCSTMLAVVLLDLSARGGTGCESNSCWFLTTTAVWWHFQCVAYCEVAASCSEAAATAGTSNKQQQQAPAATSINSSSGSSSSNQSNMRVLAVIKWMLIGRKRCFSSAERSRCSVLEMCQHSSSKCAHRTPLT